MTPAERDDFAGSMVPVACELACLVRDRDAGGIAALTASLDGSGAAALLVVLAAMIPVDDASPADLLAWAGGLEEPLQLPGGTVLRLDGSGRDLRPCGTYAAYRRHERRGEPADPLCDAAWRAWRAGRYQIRKGQPQQDEAAHVA